MLSLIQSNEGLKEQRLRFAAQQGTVTQKY